MQIILEQLKELNDDAIYREYNRSLTEDIFENIDTSIPIEQILSFPHAHKQGKPCEEHVRTMWKLKLKTGQWMMVQVDIEKQKHDNLVQQTSKVAK